jgi:regulator of protease activity HflC (stomatin/prohibitin superfamily)
MSEDTMRRTPQDIKQAIRQRLAAHAERAAAIHRAEAAKRVDGKGKERAMLSRPKQGAPPPAERPRR